MNNFILSYDLATSFHISQQLNAYVKSNRSIVQWSQPFNGVYLIKSYASVENLAQNFREFFGNSLFLIAPAPPSGVDGMLPSTFWDWLKQPDTSLAGLIAAFGGGSEAG